MTTSLVLRYFAFVGFTISESTILTPQLDVSSCSGENVTIGWQYDNPADLLSAVWTFTNASLSNERILLKIRTDPPTVPASSPLNVEFIENGTIKLINTSPSYTGTYKFNIAYSSTSSDNDSVNLTINDAPDPLVFQENVTTHTFTCSGSSSLPTVIRVSTSDGNFRYDASPYTSTVTTEGIECCYNGSGASCSTETFTATYGGTIYCQQVRDASSTPTTVPPTLFTTTQITHNTTDPDPCKWCLITPWWWWCIILIVIGISIAICIVAAIVYCWYKGKCCFEEPRKCPCCPRNNSGNETSRETKPPRRTIHDDNQGNGQSIRANGPNALPPMTGYSKVRPDDNQLSGDPDKNTPNNEANYTPRPLPILPNIRSSQAPNIDDVETETPKKKKKKKRKQTKEDQIV